MEPLVNPLSGYPNDPETLDLPPALVSITNFRLPPAHRLVFFQPIVFELSLARDDPVPGAFLPRFPHKHPLRKTMLWTRMNLPRQPVMR